MSTTDASESEHKNTKKIALIVLASLLAVLVVAYAAGVIAFNFYYMPGTTLDGQDVSLMSVSDVAAEKTGSLAGYQTHVSGNGVDLTLSAEQIDLAYAGERYAQEALEQINVWAWPYEVTRERTVSATSAVVFDRDALVALIEPFVEAAQQSADSLGSSCVTYNAESGTFTLDGSIAAGYLDMDAVVETLSEGFTAQEPEITLGADQLAIDEDDAAHLAVSSANAYLGAAGTSLVLDGQTAVEVTADQIAGWVIVADDLTVSLNEEAVRAWAAEAASGLNTVGAERTYTRPDGKQVSVSGGSYGWKVDDAGIGDALVAAISSGAAAQVEVSFTQSAAVTPDAGGRDWGNRYIDIDLSEQYVRMYDENGSIIFESACVSGNTSQGFGTPTGVNAINGNKATGQTLIGLDYNDDGEPDYESYVNYWMPFVGNMVALHDADWRYEFGGTIYQWNGSHGCINLPAAKAAELYNICQVGDVVVVHW